MGFEIDTGSGAPIPKSYGCEGLQISLRDFTRAERMHRQIIGNIESCESKLDLSDYWAGEAQMLDVMQAQRPEFFAAIKEKFDEAMAYLPDL